MSDGRRERTISVTAYAFSAIDLIWGAWRTHSTMSEKTPLSEIIETCIVPQCGNILVTETQLDYERCLRHIADAVRRLGNEQEWNCGYCGEQITEEWQIDHITPKDLGGSNRLANLQLLHPECIKAKGNEFVRPKSREQPVPTATHPIRTAPTIQETRPGTPEPLIRQTATATAAAQPRSGRKPLISEDDLPMLIITAPLWLFLGGMVLGLIGIIVQGIAEGL